MIKKIILTLLIFFSSYAIVSADSYCEQLEMFTLTPCHETDEHDNGLLVTKIKIDRNTKNIYVSESKEGKTYNIIIQVGSQLIDIRSVKNLMIYKNPGNGWHF